MINTIVPLDEIDFEPCEPGSLLESIAQRGIAIPVHVNRTGSRYTCVDGRKRLTACLRLMEREPRLKRVPVMIRNDFSKSGSGFWGNTQNRH